MSVHDTFSIVLVGQNTLGREGLRRILEEGEFEVLGSIARLADLNGSAGLISPQLVVFDHNVPEDVEEEIAAIAAVFPNSKIVVLVDTFIYELMVTVFNAGAHGYIVKRLGCDSLVTSLRLVAMGENVMPSQLANQLSESLLSNQMYLAKSADLSELLSERELETMRYLLGGNPNKVIANHLDVSEATIKVHVKSILRKLGVRNRTQAAIWAVNNGVDFGRPSFSPEASSGARLSA
ncbi:two-component system nitrate/nitrite response regulator NarL [Novosphingobium hassiacum]|uniref:Two-component system nitrate/nitrite response regulator NarL n=1 Tax=Novosphingobium hassiacum TaxID=173676 RepID=A0A7W6A0H2_9SPHN|nr:response regulator transcription factor [Novosphingobium hassiacum]MBB3862554.1 two-component system nitrate/nitrite response regulator NarL [Novosphingobium hassiacum]